MSRTDLLRDLTYALEAVYGGDQHLESGCVMDKLSDLGWVLTPAPRLSVAPMASTRGLPKRRSV